MLYRKHAFEDAVPTFVTWVKIAEDIHHANQAERRRPGAASATPGRWLSPMRVPRLRSDGGVEPGRELRIARHRMVAIRPCAGRACAKIDKHERAQSRQYEFHDFLLRDCGRSAPAARSDSRTQAANVVSGMGGRRGGIGSSPYKSTGAGARQALEPIRAKWTNPVAAGKAARAQWQDELGAGSSWQPTRGQWHGADASHGHWTARIAEMGTVMANVRIAATRTKNRRRSMSKA
jgi:hypothetical protein